MRLKEDPLPIFWRRATCWRKMRLLRHLDSMRTPIAQKYLREIIAFNEKMEVFPELLTKNHQLL